MTVSSASRVPMRPESFCVTCPQGPPTGSPSAEGPRGMGSTGTGCLSTHVAVSGPFVSVSPCARDVGAGSCTCLCFLLAL